MMKSGGEGSAQAVRERKVRADKKTRVNPGLPADVHTKLELLATSCGMTKTNMAGVLLQLALDSPDFVNSLQDKYNKNPQYRFSPVIVDNQKVKYWFLG